MILITVLVPSTSSLKYHQLEDTRWRNFLKRVVNNSININNTKNHFSHQTIEYNNTTKYGNGHRGSGLGEAYKCDRIKPTRKFEIFVHYKHAKKQGIVVSHLDLIKLEYKLRIDFDLPKLTRTTYTTVLTIYTILFISD